MTNECKCWLIGLIYGDGYIDQRHLEIYNSSESILREAVMVINSMISESRIKVDIYSESPKNDMVLRWSKILDLPSENFILRKNTSPWRSRTEKIRLRVSSKDVVDKLSIKPKHIGAYLRGLFDAEASVDVKGYIEFKQVAKEKGIKLVNDVFKILQKMGINTTTVKTKNDMGIKRDAYFYVRDLDKYQKKIGFREEIKKSKLANLIEIKKQNKIPELEEMKRLILENKGIWEIMIELKSPYHKIRKALKDNHLTIR